MKGNFIKVFALLMLIGFGSKSVEAQYHEADRWNFYWDWKAHAKGQIHFHYGYGFPRIDLEMFDHQNWKNDFRVDGVGPFYFKAEYGLSRQLSIMLSTAYTQYTSDWTEPRLDPNYNQNLNFIYGTTVHDIAAKTILHFNLRTPPLFRYSSQKHQLDLNLGQVSATFS